MASKADNAKAMTRIVLEEDEQWIRGIFESIPRGIYHGGGDLKQSNGKKQKNVVDAEATKRRPVEPKKRKQKSKKSSVKSQLSGRTDDPARAELERKLKEKIEVMRAERKAGDDDKEVVPLNRKRKREKSKDVKNTPRERKKNEPSQAQADINKKDDKEVHGLSSSQLETTRVAGFEDDGEKRKRRKMGETKLEELQRKLDEATKERELKEKINSDMRTGSTSTLNSNKKKNQNIGDEKDGGENAAIVRVVQEREIEKALMRAKGERVKDDVSKIRKSIRREKRKSVKSREEWAARVKAVNKDIKAKQEKRTKNLKERRDAKKAGTKSKKKSGKRSKRKKA